MLRCWSSYSVRRSRRTGAYSAWRGDLRDLTVPQYTQDGSRLFTAVRGVTHSLKEWEEEKNFPFVDTADVAERAGAVSILGGFQNPANQNSEQPGLSSVLILFWAGRWTRGCLQSAGFDIFLPSKLPISSSSRPISEFSYNVCLSNSIKWDAFEKLNPFFNHKEKQNQYRNERESSLHSSSTWGMSSSHILFWGWMLHLLFQPCLWGYSSTATLAQGFYSLVRLPGKEKVSLL